MLRLAVAATLLVFTSACSPFYSVGFNGYTATAAALPPGTKVFLAKNDHVANPLLEAEVRRKLGAELEARGYVLAPAEDADVFLQADFGIGTGTTSTVKDANGASVGTIETSGRVGYVPTTKTASEQWLVLTATDGRVWRERNEVSVLWRGEATIDAPEHQSDYIASSDLRTAINYLLVPIVEQFGQNTGERTEYYISEGDKAAQRIRSRE